MQNERQLKALQDDLAKIDALLEGPLTEEKIADFERDHAEIVPELYRKHAHASLDSSINTVSGWLFKLVSFLHFRHKVSSKYLLIDLDGGIP